MGFRVWLYTQPSGRQLQYAPDVRRFVCYLTGSDDAAAEITSETLLRAWTTSGRIREESAKGYLLAIARNLAAR